MKVDSRQAFGLLLTAFVMLAIGYSVTVPLGESSDEVSHWSYIQYLAAHRELPKPEGAVLGEAHQPPLYYIVGALVTGWIPAQEWEPIANPDFSLDDPQSPPNVLLHTRREGFPYEGAALAWHLVRLLSVLMGAVTIWATWRLGRLLTRETVALAAAAFVAFLPEFLFISAVVNNDNLVIMLSSLGVLLLVRMLGKPLTWRDSALLGLVLGLALLSKLSGAVLWVFAGVVLLARMRRQRNYGEAVLHGVLVFGIAALVVSPWVISNLLRYGDPVGWSLLAAVTPNRTAPLTAADWQIFLQGLYTSFWGRFGGVVQIRMPDPVYAALGFLALLGMVGWSGYLRDARRGRLASGTVTLALLFAAFWLILLAAHLRWTLTILGTDQARQLFPGLPLLALFWALGLARLFASRARVAFAVWGTAAGVLALAILLFLQSTFAPPFVAASTLQPSAAAADFGQVIRMLDYTLNRTRLSPGDTLALDVHWQALRDVPDNYWVLIQLAGNDAVTLNKDGAPSAGRLSTDWWRQGNILPSHHLLRIPDELALGTYTLRVGLHAFGQWDWLPVRGRDMLDLETIEIVPYTPTVYPTDPPQ